jgi:hypothetical protein
MDLMSLLNALKNGVVCVINEFEGLRGAIETIFTMHSNITPEHKMRVIQFAKTLGVDIPRTFSAE